MVSNRQWKSSFSRGAPFPRPRHRGEDKSPAETHAGGSCRAAGMGGSRQWDGSWCRPTSPATSWPCPRHCPMPSTSSSGAGAEHSRISLQLQTLVSLRFRGVTRRALIPGESCVCSSRNRVPEDHRLPLSPASAHVSYIHASVVHTSLSPTAVSARCWERSSHSCRLYFSGC